MKKLSPKPKKGPIEVVESKGARIPIYAGLHHGKKSFLISYYSSGKRVRDRATTIEGARKLARSKAEGLATGAVHIEPLTPTQAAVVKVAVETLSPTKIRLSEAVRQFTEAHRILGGKGSVVDAARFYAQDFQRSQIQKKLFSEVVTEFLTSIENEELSQQYLRDCRKRLGRAAKAFQVQITEIEPEVIDAWLSQGRRSPRTYNNDRNALVTLFNFAKRKRYLPSDRESAAERVKKRKDVAEEISILTPEGYALLLTHTPQAFLPYVLLGGLAGLRTAEISRLDWSEINFTEGHILITAAKAKTASRRIVPMCATLKKMLSPLSRKKGPVMPYANEQSMMNRWSRLKALMATPENRPIVEVPTNALRHSYASYRLAATEDAAKVSLEMGNSPRKLFESYRKMVTKRQAEKWFSLMPPRFRKKPKPAVA